MFTYYGWISIHNVNINRQFNKEQISIDVCENLYEKLVAKIKQKIEETGFSTIKYVILKDMYGLYVLHLSGIRNHYNPYPKNLFEWINKNAPFSFGLLFEYDDEDDKNYNKFQITKIAKGECVECNDHFFSPIIPILFDNDDDR